MDISISSIPAFLGFLLEHIKDIWVGNTGQLLIDTSSPFVRRNGSLMKRLFCAA